MEPREFICTDCGVQVYGFLPYKEDICSVCYFLRYMVKDDKLREELRKHLQKE